MRFFPKMKYKSPSGDRRRPVLELLGLCPKPHRYGLLLHRLTLTASASA